MAHSKQAIKRERNNQKNRMNNKIKKSILKTTLSKLDSIIATRDHASAMQSFSKTTSVLDSYAARGILAKNKAARLKKAYNKKILALLAAS